MSGQDFSRRLALCLLAIGLLACSDPAGPITVAAVSIESERLFDGLIQLDVDERSVLTARVLDANGREIPNPRITWSSSRPQIADVDSTGTLRGAVLRSPDYDGTTITASAGGQSATVRVLVVPSRPYTIDALPNLTLAPGASVQLHPVVRDIFGNILSGWGIPSYETTDGSIAWVDGGGLLRAFAHPGSTSREATIRLVGHQRRFYGSFKVTVLPVPITLVQIDAGSGIVPVGGQLQLRAIPLRDVGTVWYPDFDAHVEWTALPSPAAKFGSDGVVVGLKPGTITVFAKVDGQTASKTLTVQ